nr:hypothetical protein [uncultured Campylobacter sp.]
MQILPVRVRKSRAYVFGALCQSRFGVFLCELDAQTASVLSPQTQKPA